MKYELSLRDILRLYYTVPVKERYISRTDEWRWKCLELRTTNSPEKRLKILLWLLNNNYWLLTHVLPYWLIKKNHISGLSYTKKFDRFIEIDKSDLEKIDVPELTFEDRGDKWRITKSS
jgi:hypothetical protein